MYTQRGKKIIIITISIVALILALSIGGVYAYLNTDLFKFTDKLFFKYVGQVIDDLKPAQNRQIEGFIDLMEQKPYQMGGKIQFGKNENEFNSNPSSNIYFEEDKLNNKMYAKLNLELNNQNIFEVEYANSNNIYALKSDEIVTSFIGIENDNLKVLAQKLGIKDVTSIPNSVDVEKMGLSIKSIKDFFSLTEDEKNHINNTYMEVLNNNINKNSFTKEKGLTVSKNGVSYNSTAYRLKLSGEEIKQLQIAMLEALKEDSITLNLILTKMKTFGLSDEDININNLSEYIQKTIDEVKLEQRQDGGITIMIYTDKGKVITTEIIYNNEIKYTIYGDSAENTSSRYLLIENLNTDAEYAKIEILEKETRSAEQSVYNIDINYDDKTIVNEVLTVSGSSSLNYADINYEATSTENEDILYTIVYNGKLQFNEETQRIVHLTRNNCAVLNDYTTEQIQYLINAISQRAAEVFNEKYQILSTYLSKTTENRTVTSNQNIITQLSEQEVASFNSRFESYKGKISGVNLKALKNLVESNNTSNMENQVTLYIDGKRSFGDNIEINNNETYTVIMQYDSDTGFVNQITANKD